jgi:hypothetical protein
MLLGVTVPPRIAKGLGIIVMIFSVITFLAAFGDFQRSHRVEHQKRLVERKGNSRNHREDLAQTSHTSRRV